MMPSSPPSLRSTPLLTVALMLMVLPVAGCLQQNTVRTGEPLRATESRKLGPFIHYQDGPTLFVGVDLRAAQYIKDDAIFPIGIALANQSRSPLTFNLEGFTLEDSEGNQYPPASLKEYNNYNRSRADGRLAENFIGILSQRFTNYNFYRWSPFPSRDGGGTAQNALELQRLFWTTTYLYFPVPESGLHKKRFTLLVHADPLDESFVVRFPVP